MIAVEGVIDWATTAFDVYTGSPIPTPMQELRFLLDECAGVDRKGYTGDVPRFVGGEKTNGTADVGRVYPWDRQRFDRLRRRSEVFSRRIF